MVSNRPRYRLSVRKMPALPGRAMKPLLNRVNVALPETQVVREVGPLGVKALAKHLAKGHGTPARYYPPLAQADRRIKILQLASKSVVARAGPR